MCVVKDGPDVTLFNHPAALTKLALWIGEAIDELDHEKKGKLSHGGRGTPLVVASLNDARGVYVIVGTGGGGNGLQFIMEREARRAKKAEKEKKAKAREEKRRLRAKEKAEKRRAKANGRQASTGDDGEDEDEEAETESEASSDSDSDSEDEKEQPRGWGRNRFGNAFQEVVEETNARVRIDSFEHCVVEVKIDDLSPFLESLSMKPVVG